MRYCLAACIVLFMSVAPARATAIEIGDPYQMSFHASTCTLCWPWSTSPELTLDGTLTVALASGNFWDPIYQMYWTRALMITDVSGTMTVDCLGVAWCTGSGSYAMSFLPTTHSDGSYLLWGIPRLFVFGLDGPVIGSSIFNDNAFNLASWSGTMVPVTWSSQVIPTPEVSTLTMLLAANVLLFVFARRSRHG